MSVDSQKPALSTQRIPSLRSDMVHFSKARAIHSILELTLLAKVLLRSWLTEHLRKPIDIPLDQISV